MSEEQNEHSRRTRRITRSQRNRPVLVTNNDTGVALDTKQADEATVTEPATDAVNIDEVPATPDTGPRRRLRFFSTIGESADDGEKKEVDVTQARLARAMRSKTGKSATAKVEVPSKEAGKDAGTEEKKSARPASRTPQRPTSPFKTRWIIGMAIYLLAANFLGAYEIQFMRAMHADTVLTSFNLFSGKVIISSSTLVFLATLVITLVLLARLDLIPRSLTGTGPQPAKKASGEKTSQSSEPAPRYIQPPVRQGVKGSDDELYQAYRANQRREKKK
jgi:hypothetical protein